MTPTPWPLSGLALGVRLQPRAVAARGLGARTSRSCARPASRSSTVGIFSWALLEPSEGRASTSAGSTRCSDLLHAGGIAVDLATATASPPPWLSPQHPEILPVDHDGSPALAGQPAGVVPELAGVPRARSGPR